MSDPSKGVGNNLGFQSPLTVVTDVEIHLPATGRITIDGSPVRIGFNDVDHGGVDHVATFPVDSGVHSFSWDGPMNQHDPPVVSGKHRPTGNRAFDTQVENRFRHRDSLKDDPRKLEVVVE